MYKRLYVKDKITKKQMSMPLSEHTFNGPFKQATIDAFVRNAITAIVWKEYTDLGVATEYKDGGGYKIIFNTEEDRYCFVRERQERINKAYVTIKECQETDFVVLLDGSSQMQPVAHNIISELNNMANEYKEEEKDLFLSVLSYNENVEEVLSRQNIKTFAPIARDKYRPLDKSKLIKGLEYIVNSDKYKKDKKILLVINSDSNASPKAKIKAYLNKLREDGWNILFVSSNLDEAKKMGVKADESIEYYFDALETSGMFEEIKEKIIK